MEEKVDGMIMFVMSFYGPILAAILILFVSLLFYIMKFKSSLNSDSLLGQHVVVTGGSSGIGKSVAMQAAARGANVTIIARDLNKLRMAKDEVSKSCSSTLQRIATYSLDVTSDPELVGKCLAEAEEGSGPVFMLINCAGQAVCGKIEDTSVNEFKYMMDLNYYGTVYPIKAVLPGMKARGQGHIVITSSQAGMLGVFGLVKVLNIVFQYMMDLNYYGTVYPIKAVLPGMKARGQGHIIITSSLAGMLIVFGLVKVLNIVFQYMMDLNYYGTVYPIRAVLPGMKGRGQGHIIITSSLAGMLSVFGLVKVLNIVFQYMMDLNYYGTVYPIRAVLPGMKARGQGHIVITSSQAGMLGVFGLVKVLNIVFQYMIDLNYYGTVYPIKAVLPGMKARGQGHIIITSSLAGMLSVFGLVKVLNIVFQYMMDLNYYGTVYPIKAVLPGMKARGQGHIIITSSLAGMLSVFGLVKVLNIVFQYMMDLNYYGTVYPIRAVLPGMKARGQGHIIITSSLAGMLSVFGLVKVLNIVFQYMMDLNYYGTVYPIRAVLPGMKARGQGHIIITSSLAGMLSVFGLVKVLNIVFQYMMDLNYYGTVYPIRAVLPGMKARGQGHIIITSSLAGMLSVFGLVKVLNIVFQYMMDLNYYGTVYPIRAVLPGMKARGQGHIVITSSQAGMLGVFGLAAYSASKFALRGFAESLDMEVRPYGVRVTVCLPPDTDTPGFVVEQINKPMETRLISQTSGLVSPHVVASQLLDDAAAGKFFSTVGFEGFLLTTVCAGMSPVTSVIDLISQVTLMGLIRLIILYYLLTFRNIIRKCIKNKDLAKKSE